MSLKSIINRPRNYIHWKIFGVLSQTWVKKLVTLLISRSMRSTLIKLLVGIDAYAINITKRDNKDGQGEYDPQVRFKNSRIIIM